MKYLSVLVFSFFLSNLSGQKDMSIDIVGSFEYAGASNYDFIADMNFSNISIKSSQTSVIPTKRLGVNFNFRIYQNIMFKTGIRVAKLGSKFSAEYQHATPCYIPGQSESNSTMVLQYVDEFTNAYIELPLIARYEYSKKRFQPYIEIGVSPHLYMNSQRNYRTIYNNGFSYGVDEATTGFNKIQLVLVLSAGMNYNISQSLTAFAQPTIRRHLNSMRMNVDGSNARFYSLGLEFGMRYNFGSYFHSSKS